MLPSVYSWRLHSVGDYPFNDNSCVCFGGPFNNFITPIFTLSSATTCVLSVVSGLCELYVQPAYVPCHVCVCVCEITHVCVVCFFMSHSIFQFRVCVKIRDKTGLESWVIGTKHQRHTEKMKGDCEQTKRDKTKTEADSTQNDESYNKRQNTRHGELTQIDQISYELQ